MGRKCITPYCSNVPTKGRICSKCRTRKFKEKHPIKYVYNKLKYGARKRRGHAVTITFEEFKALVLGTRYLDKKGKTKGSLQIDRIDDDKGYEPGNLRIITVSENIAKENRRRHCKFMIDMFGDPREKPLSETDSNEPF